MPDDQVIPPPERGGTKHRHILPDPDKHGFDTLSRCLDPGCEKWFGLEVIRDGDTGVQRVWQRVRWWEFRRRRRIAEYLGERP